MLQADWNRADVVWVSWRNWQEWFGFAVLAAGIVMVLPNRITGTLTA